MRLRVHPWKWWRFARGCLAPRASGNADQLAFTWKDRGRHAEAFKLTEKCMQLRNRISGTDHPNTLSSSAALTGWQTEIGDWCLRHQRPGSNDVISQME